MTFQQLFDDWYQCRESLIWEFGTTITSDRVALHIEAIHVAIGLGLVPPDRPSLWEYEDEWYEDE